MTTLLIVLVLVVAALGVWWTLRGRAARRVDSHPADQLDTLAAWPPQATRVLTTSEREAYDVLRRALPAHMILAQVPLQRFIKVPTRNSYSEWLRRVGHLSADLLVCDRHSQVVAVVEIIGSEPLSVRAERRRERMARVLRAAEIPVHLWPAATLPTPEAARAAIVPTPAAAESAPPAAVPGSRSLPGSLSGSGAFADEAREPADEDEGTVREPPPSTWFDDLETQPAPLTPEPSKDPRELKSRPGR